MQSTSRFILVIGLMAALAGCSSNSDNPVVVQATPTPTPTPTPEPTPEPAAALGCQVPATEDCTAPEGPAGTYGCCHEAEAADDQFGYATEFALGVIERDHPELLNGPEGRVGDLQAFTTKICEIIEENFALCCAQKGPADEVAVKEDNTRSEQHDVMFGDEPGFLRHNGYAAWCEPARF